MENSDQEIKRGGKSFLHIAFLALAVFILPVFGLYRLSYRFETMHLQSRIAAEEDEIYRVTAHFARLAQPETYYQELAERLARSFKWQSNVDELLNNRTAAPLTLYLFDEKLDRIFLPGFERDKTAVSKQYMEMVIRTTSNNAKAMSRLEESIAEGFSGSAATVKFLADREGSLSSLAETGVQKLGGWFKVAFHDSTTGYLLVWVDRDKIPAYLLLRQAMRKMTELAGFKYQFGWFDFEAARNHKPTKREVSGAKDFSGSFRKLLAESAIKTLFRLRDKIICVTDVCNSFRLVCAVKTPKASDFFSKFRTMLVVIAVSAALTLLWLCIFEVSVSLSIRTQLIAIFGIAGIGGLSVLIAFSYLHRNSRQKSLIRDSHENQLKILEKLDENFLRSFSDSVIEYRNIVKRLKLQTGNYAEILEPLVERPDSAKLELVALVNESGKILYETASSKGPTAADGVRERYKALIQRVGKEAIEKYNAYPGKTNRDTDESGNEDDKPDTEGRPRTAIGVILDRPIDQLIKNRSQLEMTRIVGDETSSFFDFVTDDNGRAFACLFIIHDTRDLANRYISKVGQWLHYNTDYRLAAFPVQGTQKIGLFPGNSILRENELRNIRQLSRQSGLIQKRIGRVNEVMSIITAMPGRMLLDYDLAIHSPLEPIARETRRILRNFITIALTSSFFALLLAWLLAGMLLHPIRELAEGIENLSAMRPHLTVKIKTADELEKIGEGLNSILDSIKEFSMARTIQENLLPSLPVQLGHLFCQGWNRSTSDTTGELYDYLPLTNGKLAFYIIDVSGKGVSSALLMAMAKMAMQLFFQYHEDSVSTVLRETDQFFRYNLRSLPQITIFAGIISPDNGELTYCGAGNIYPMIVQTPNSDGSENVKLLEELSPHPLGSHYQGKFTDRKIQLRQEDRLLVCTDGLINCLSKDGQPFGINRFRELAKTVSTLPVEKTGAYLFKQLDEFVQTTSVIDDQTVLTIAFSSGSLNEPSLHQRKHR